MVRGLGVYADDACSCLCKLADIVFRMFNHQVTVERELGAFLDAGRNTWAKADVWDKVSIHDVEMNEAGATVFDSLESVAKFEEVCVQHAGGDNLLEHTPNIEIPPPPITMDSKFLLDKFCCFYYLCAQNKARR